jgi:tetratricopeptide (TPR) repeat protein
LLQATSALAQQPSSGKIPEAIKLQIDEYFYEGNKQLQLGNRLQAEQAFRKCISIYPKHHASLYMLGIIKKEGRSYIEAIPFFKEAAELDPLCSWYQENLAEMYRSSMKFKEAAEVYKKLSYTFPDNNKYIELTSESYIAAGEYKKAIAIQNKIEKRDGVNELTSTTKEQLYLQLNKPEKALAELRKLCTAYPASLQYQGMMADLYIDMGLEKDALAIYNRILEADPANGYAHFALSDYYTTKGDKLRSFDELRKAFSDKRVDLQKKFPVFVSRLKQNRENKVGLEQLEELADTLEHAHPDDALVYRISADLFVNSKQYDKAIEKYEQSLKLDPSQQEIYGSLVELDLQQNNYTKLEEHARRGKELFPNLTLFFYYHAVACNQLKQYSKAIQSAKEGIETAPLDESMLQQLYAVMGDAGYFDNNFAVSDSAYDEALKMDSNNAYVLNNYAYFLSVRNSKLAQAERMSKRTLDQQPENDTYMDTYGWILYKLGRYAEAETYIKNAAEKSSNSAEVLEHLGDVSWKLGKKDEAIQAWQKALEIGKGSKFLEQKVREKRMVE